MMKKDNTDWNYNIKEFIESSGIILGMTALVLLARKYPHSIGFVLIIVFIYAILNAKISGK